MTSTAQACDESECDICEGCATCLNEDCPNWGGCDVWTHHSAVNQLLCGECQVDAGGIPVCPIHHSEADCVRCLETWEEMGLVVSYGSVEEQWTCVDKNCDKCT